MRETFCTNCKSTQIYTYIVLLYLLDTVVSMIDREMKMSERYSVKRLYPVCYSIENIGND